MTDPQDDGKRNADEHVTYAAVIRTSTSPEGACREPRGRYVCCVTKWTGACRTPKEISQRAHKSYATSQVSATLSPDDRW